MGMDVVCGLIKRDTKIWMGKRPMHKHMGGFWEFPGGKVFDGEAPEEALKRELREELGVEVSDIVPAVEIEYSYPDKHIRLIAFEVEFPGPVNLLEHEEEQWVDLRESVFEKWAPADIALWKKWRLKRSL